MNSIMQHEAAAYAHGRLPQRHQPIVSFGHNHTHGDDDIMAQLRHKVETQHRSVTDAFRILDRDNSGGISREELEAALVRYNIPAHHISQFMRKLDTNCDGVVSFAEFAAALSPRADAFGARCSPDSFVANRHVVVPNVAGGQVWHNDNLPLGAASGELRPDAQLMGLPHSRANATSAQLADYTSTLSSLIYTKHSKLRDAFRAMDFNKDGRLSEAELKRAVRTYNLPIPEEHVQQIFQQCDRNRDGHVNYEEFALALKRRDALGH